MWGRVKLRNTKAELPGDEVSFNIVLLPAYSRKKHVPSFREDNTSGKGKSRKDKVSNQGLRNKLTSWNLSSLISQNTRPDSLSTLNSS